MRNEEEIKEDIRELLKRKQELQLSLQRLNEQYAILKKELFEKKFNTVEKKEEEKKK